MTRHALFIGNDQYRDPSIQPLKQAQSDAANLHGLFKHLLGYGENAHLLLAPSVDDVMDKLHALSRQVRPGDRFVFFFAGHGLQGGLGQRGVHYLLLGKVDTQLLRQGQTEGVPGLLSMQTLCQATDGWAGVQRVFLLDSCRNAVHAGNHRGLMDGEIGLQQAALTRDLQLGRRSTSPSDSQTPVVLCACQHGETAVELSRGGQFSTALAEEVDEAVRQRQPVVLNRGLVSSLARRMSQLAQLEGHAGGQVPWLNLPDQAAALFLPDELKIEIEGNLRPGNQGVDRPVNRPTASGPNEHDRGTPRTQRRNWAHWSVGSLVLVASGTLVWRTVMPSAPPAIPGSAVNQNTQNAPLTVNVPVNIYNQPAAPTPPPHSAPAPTVNSTAPSTAARTIASGMAKPAINSTVASEATSSRYLNWSAIPPSGQDAMAFSGHNGIVAQIARQLPPMSQRLFKPEFYSDGLFSQALRGDAEGLRQLHLEPRVKTVHLLQVSDPVIGAPNASLEGLIVARATATYRLIDPSNGGTLHSAQVPLVGQGFSTETAMAQLLADVGAKSSQFFATK